MIPPNDVIADLPSPFDDEPPSVRQDIADELSDHLACAYRRELLKTADERTAQQRVLDRFGNPQRIAYQLWFQALWGRIMLGRFARVWQGVKVVAGLAALFLVFRMAEQQSALHNQLQFMTASYNSMQSQTMGNRMLLEQMLARLPAPPPQRPGEEGGMGMAGGMMMAGDAGAMVPSGSMGMMPGGMGASMGGSAMSAIGLSSTDVDAVQAGLIVQLTIQGTSNEPAAGCLVAVVAEQGQRLQLIGTTLNAGGFGSGMPGSMGSFAGYPGVPQSGMRQTSGGNWVTPEMQGKLRFIQPQQGGPSTAVEPGRYTLYVEFPDGRQSQRLIVIPPSSKTVSHTENVVCPAPGENAYVVFHTALVPQDLIDAQFAVVAAVKRKSTTIDRTSWQTGNDTDDLFLTFDPKTGAPLSYDRNSGNYSDLYSYFGNFREGGNRLATGFAQLATEDRFLKVPSGDYEVTLGWWHLKARCLVQRTVSKEEIGYEPWSRVAYAAAGAAENGVLTVSADTRDVLLDFPEGMLAEARKALAEMNAAAKKPTSETDASSKVNFPAPESLSPSQPSPAEKETRPR